MFAAIKRFFSSLLRKLWRIINKVISGALEKFLADFLEIATNIVRNLVNSDFSNEAKRKQAFSRIKNIVVSKGEEYKDNWINILIELAVAAVKVEF